MASGFIRPEARATLWNWREVLVSAALAVLALRWISAAQGILWWLALVLLAACAAFCWIGIQRARFRQSGGGLGVVQIDEGAVSYFGPLSGGVVSVAEIQRLGLDGRQRPPHWVLEQPEQPPLMIPVNAEGADALIDGLSSLPGLRINDVLRARSQNTSADVTVWTRKT